MKVLLILQTLLSLYFELNHAVFEIVAFVEAEIEAVT